MKKDLLLKKLYLEGKDFVTSDELKRYCKSLKLNYNSMSAYLLSRNYLERIFRGIFYVRNLEEVKLGKERYSHLELVSKALEIKGVRNWHFGLYTALKLNNMTHEHFAVDYVVSDSIFRARPMEIAGHKFRFLKFRPDLLVFGIVSKGVRHSDPEKTMLDFIYMWRYNGIPEEKIMADISDYSVNLSREKVLRYARNYPKSVRAIAKKVIT